MRIGEEVFLKEEIDELTILSKGNNLCECTFKTCNNNIHTVTFSNEILEYNNGDPVDDYSTDETEEEEEKVYLKEGIDELTIISIENEL
ncbi:MAG: hypothetical protein KDC52_11685, partial [Ignavibacteriae bacterium]|nr:hypothetical protein [Ignavibacteriota bacterium]